MGHDGMAKRLASGLILWLLCGAAWASCSGSGLTWSCTSGSTAAQINTAISSASDGATITLDAGTYTASGIDLTSGSRNGVTLICATVEGCTMSASGTVFEAINHSYRITNLVRISGFKFTGTASGIIWFYSQGTYGLDKFRIDNNRFENIGAGQIAIFIGENTSTGCSWGVVDNNTFTATTYNFMAMKSLNCGESSRTANAWLTGTRGTWQNVFFEDNTCDFADNTDLATGCVDAWKGGGVVTRYNTVTGARFLTHSYCHGGPANWESYGNTIQNATADVPNYRNMHSQGSGEITIFDNVIYTSGSTTYFEIQHFRSDSSLATTEGSCNSVCNGSYGATGFEGADGNRTSWFGYPCWHQPGRDGDGTLKPVYIWNNRNQSGTKVSMEGGGTGTCANNDTDLINCHFRPDRDYFEAVSANAQSSATSPFNGTTGMGFGTLANRPTTCSRGDTMAEDGSAGGVGYWATDIQTLYRCSATNTWTVDYRPYVYPHPLASGKPAPPTNPRTK